jgi:hypothetical protein
MLRSLPASSFFAIQSNVGTIPTFDAGWYPEDPEEFVLSVCSTLVTIANVGGEKVEQLERFKFCESIFESHRNF